MQETLATDGSCCVAHSAVAHKSDLASLGTVVGSCGMLRSAAAGSCRRLQACCAASKLAGPQACMTCWLAGDVLQACLLGGLLVNISFPSCSCYSVTLLWHYQLSPWPPATSFAAMPLFDAIDDACTFPAPSLTTRVFIPGCRFSPWPWPFRFFLCPFFFFSHGRETSPISFKASGGSGGVPVILIAHVSESLHCYTLLLRIDRGGRLPLEPPLTPLSHIRPTPLTPLSLCPPAMALQCQMASFPPPSFHAPA